MEEVEGELSADAAADACDASVAKRARGWREVPVMRMDGVIDEELRGLMRVGTSGTRFKARDCSARAGGGSGEFTVGVLHTWRG